MYPKVHRTPTEEMYSFSRDTGSLNRIFHEKLLDTRQAMDECVQRGFAHLKTENPEVIEFTTTENIGIPAPYWEKAEPVNDDAAKLVHAITSHRNEGPEIVKKSLEEIFKRARQELGYQGTEKHLDRAPCGRWKKTTLYTLSR